MSNVLVVDDSISVRKALELSLKKEGLDVRSAASAEQALEQMDAAPTDLVIADVIMPGLSGFELCQKLKADGRYRNVPVLIISGNVDPETRQQAHQVGAEGVLKKPFHHDELMPAVNQALSAGAGAKATDQVTRAAGAAPAESVVTPPQEVMVNPPATQARPQAHSGAFSAMLDRAAAGRDVLSAALVERDGTPLEQRGQPLPDNIGQFARFYMGTAEFLAGRLGESGAGQLDLELGGKRLTVRGLGDKLLVTLSHL